MNIRHDFDKARTLIEKEKLIKWKDQELKALSLLIHDIVKKRK